MILQRDEIDDNTTNFYFLTDTIYRENYNDRKITMLSFQRRSEVPRAPQRRFKKYFSKCQFALLWAHKADFAKLNAKIVILIKIKKQPFLVLAKTSTFS